LDQTVSQLLSEISTRSLTSVSRRSRSDSELLR